MHETETSNGGWLISARLSAALKSLAVPLCLCPLMLAFCDWWILIYTSSVLREHPDIVVCPAPQRTPHTIATVVRPDAPRWLLTSLLPTRPLVLVSSSHSHPESPLQGQETSALAPRSTAFGSSTFPTPVRASLKRAAPTTTRTSIALILAFMNWFSVAALSRRSLVRCIGLRPLSMSVSTCIGTRVVRFDPTPSSPAKYPTTSFLPHVKH